MLPRVRGLLLRSPTAARRWDLVSLPVGAGVDVYAESLPAALGMSTSAAELDPSSPVLALDTKFESLESGIVAVGVSGDVVGEGGSCGSGWLIDVFGRLGVRS